MPKDLPKHARAVVVGGGIVGYSVAYHLTELTSAGYGYTVGESIAYSYLPLEHAEVGSPVEIEYFGTRHGATIAQEPLFDPENARLKS